MTSIYRRALGSEFERLHPEIQRRFSLSSEGGIAAVGTGVMDEVWRGKSYTLPFLMTGTWRNIMFPDRGRNIPFTIANYAYRDGFGRETVTWVRTFDFERKRRRFDAQMIYSSERGCLVDYLGTHQHLAVDIHLAVDDEGGLRLRSGEQRFYEGRLGFRFPMALSGYAGVREWFDEASEVFRISVDVSNPYWGPLFGYEGSFTVEWTPCLPDDVPLAVKPVREERRE